MSIITHAIPYTLALLVPAIALSWYAGNKFGALAARRKTLDNTVLPVGYALTATPYMWLGILLVWVLAVTWQVFPVGFGYDPTAIRGFTLVLRREPRLPLVPARSCRCSSSPSAAGRSGCAT